MDGEDMLHSVRHCFGVMKAPQSQAPLSLIRTLLTQLFREPEQTDHLVHQVTASIR
jgi:hypothetical protein